MAHRNKVSRWKIILRAWPPAGALFVLLSFCITAFWTVYSLTQDPWGLRWLEPLAAFLAGTGAFILAAILIFRKVDSARAESDSYGLARGLATGYYFNFVRPLVAVLNDPNHPLHQQVRDMGDYELEALVVGLPQSMEDFDPGRHDTLLEGLSKGPDAPFVLEEIKVNIEGRPRPVWTKLARSKTGKTAILVDIPTTLSVIADFARFFAEQELGDAPGADDAVIEAREEIVADSQTGQFQEVLIEFIDVMNKVGSMESRFLSPASVLHVVSFKRLRRRMDELADH